MCHIESLSPNHRSIKFMGPGCDAVSDATRHIFPALQDGSRKSHSPLSTLELLQPLGSGVLPL